MNVLILGGGGREHALAWSVSKSPELDRLIVAPGNAGTEELGENAALDIMDGPAVLEFCREEEIDLVIIGPEAPLVVGVADVLRDAGIATFGPSAEAAQLEGSKAHAKELMLAEDIPTARSATVRSVAEAIKAIDYLGDRLAVKADGLAAGKGVVMANGRDEIVEAVRAATEDGRFGKAGSRVLLEEWLEGEEASLIAIVSGDEVRPLLPAQDHKRAHDGDAGPNTGGMGAYAPYPGLAGAELDEAIELCLERTSRALSRRRVDFRGVLYAGLMLTEKGPRVLEYNVRFGDPETQVLLPLMRGDMLEVFAAAANGDLRSLPTLELRRECALTVVLAAEGYPEKARTGCVIEGLEEVRSRDHVKAFHAGTRRDAEGQVVSNGGRILTVTGLGDTLAMARDRAYDAVSAIRIDGAFHRSDIGHRGLEWASLMRLGGPNT